MNIQQAKQLPLAQVLAALGFGSHHRRGDDIWYLSPFRKESEPSFKINSVRNVWYDHGAGKGGTIIDFIMEYKGLRSVSEVLQHVERIIGSPRSELRHRPQQQPSPALRPSKAAMTIDTIQAVQTKGLIDYLGQRAIPLEIATSHLKEIYYTRNNKRYFSLAFANQSSGWELRNAYFKGSISPKDISLIGELDKDSSGLLVFEGFFDYLSALTYYDNEIKHPAIVLNSVAMKDKALEVIHRLRPEAVYLYLDRDQNGMQLQSYFQEALTAMSVVDKSPLYEGHKDFNEFLQQRG